MSDRPRSVLWDRWLVVVGWVVVAFGMMLALFNRSLPMELAFHRNIDRAFWPSAPPPEAVAFRTWIYGVLGATMAGWGIAMVALARRAFARRERWARDAIVVCVLLWYVTDTSLSLVACVTFNALFNTSLLVLIGPPLIATWRQFPREGD